MRDETNTVLAGSITPESFLQTPSTPTEMMGTRRRPKDFGKYPNVIGNRQSNDSSMNPDQFRN